MLKILPDEVEKCFYIDGDMIVNTDLATVYEQLDSNKLAAVVTEIQAMLHRDTTLKHLNDMDDFHFFQADPFNAPYFNAGFFLLNVKKAKKLKLYEAAFDFLRRYPNPPYADQDTLNAVIGQKYHNMLIYLSPAYNVFCDIDYCDSFSIPHYTAEDIKQAFNYPKIYHYAGGNKPWINAKIKHAYNVWWAYAKKSPWYRQIKETCNKRKKEITYLQLFSLFPLLSWEKIKKVSAKL
jgi:lipopolysaccharide biosynthesis glycosyltransferase